VACNGCEFIPELYYDAEFQIWIRVESDGLLTVGMTDLSQTIAGKILHLRVRKPGTRRPPGKPVATIESGKWAGPIPNFIDCEIVAANAEALENPVLLNSDPYNAWVAQVKSVLPVEVALENFLTGEAAQQGYCERARREDIQCQRMMG
jgi:glycine cleavage system H protein